MSSGSRVTLPETAEPAPPIPSPSSSDESKSDSGGGGTSAIIALCSAIRAWKAAFDIFGVGGGGAYSKLLLGVAGTGAGACAGTGAGAGAGAVPGARVCQNLN